MEFNALTAISPIDGRYQSKTAALQAYFSEFGLIRYRVLVEVEYLIALVESGISNLSTFPKGQPCTQGHLHQFFASRRPLDQRN
jgi:adenylosuccinate lyase